ncbi:hypothetical protein Fmac_026319 [Flemingia macrophylla]|uniref:GRF-type domain-containing protein n=1 Tax=Flemingia macrophylla TaxID=520843 RepID=A0ABD1LEJ0_9FABA
MVKSADLESSNVTLSCNKKSRMCYCGVPCNIKTATIVKNYGCKFYGCGNYYGYNKHCQFFMWSNSDDEVDDDEQLCILVASQKSEIDLLKDMIHKMNKDDEIEHLKVVVDKLNNEVKFLNSKIEETKEDLMDVVNSIDSHVRQYKKFKFIIMSLIVLVVVKLLYF